MSSLPPTGNDDNAQPFSSRATGALLLPFRRLTGNVATNKKEQSLNEEQPALKEGHLQLPSYGSCPSRLRRPPSPPQASPPPSDFLMGSATPDISDPSNNNNESSPPSSSSPIAAAALNTTAESGAAATGTAAPATNADQYSTTAATNAASILATEPAKEEETSSSNNQPTSRSSSILNMANNLLAPLNLLKHRLLHQTVLADKLALYSLLDALSTNGRYASLGFLVIYLLFVLLIWIPLWLLGLMVTEWGVYALLLMSVAYGGRCLLRLLAFPGTSVRVYGEIENEFSRYSCKMLEGGCGALEDFAKALRAAGEKDPGWTLTQVELTRKRLDGWDVADIPATYKRAMVYKKRVFGVYFEVLHCLLEENGQGCDLLSPPASDGGGGRNEFYSLGCDSVSACRDKCKRNLCCERTASSNGSSSNGEPPRSSSEIEGIEPPPPLINHSPSNSSIDGTSCFAATTRHGNNPLIGDIGNMGNLTPQARSDGRELLELLTSLLRDLSELESSASTVLRVLDKKDQLKDAKLSKESVGQATALIQKAREFRQLISRINVVPSSSDSDNNDNGDGDTQHDEEDVGAEAVRHRLEEQGGTASSTSAAGSSGSTLGMMRSAARAFGSMIDPPPHESIFGLDVIRGTFLARYRGARQFWVERGGDDGRLDVILIPSSAKERKDKDSSFESFLPLSPRKGRVDEIVVRKPSSSSGAGRGNSLGKKVRAVLYLNPNAGLVEVATGMGLTGGNIAIEDKDDDEKKEPTCWTEYYIEHGYDVYLFNYAGYGRSFGGSSAWNDTTTEFSHGFWGSLKRVLFSTFLAFKPSSESLKSDAAAVAHHLVDVVGVDELVIHGESIGGMAAAGAARALTAAAAPNAPPTPKSSTLLICDRTFCNLEAVAQRLVGQWTGNAIRLLTPTWSTDVARDFLAARCPKIVANDCADEIIHDHSSLKTGLAFAGELMGGRTNGAGWIALAPLEYRMADLDNVGVANSRVAGASCGGGGSCRVKSSPTWPADKHASWSEAYHFAACVKRIGKLATATKKRLRASLSNVEEAGVGVEVAYASDDSPDTQLSLADNRSRSLQKESETKTLIKLWNSLACCDGLCGHPLGHAVKEGFDCTVAWLCCTVVFGSHVLAEKAKMRWVEQQQQRSSTQDTLATGLNVDTGIGVFLPEDFDLRPEGYQWDEDDLMRHPLPIPVVLSSLKEMNAQKNHLMEEVESELNYVIGMLEYIVSRLTSKESLTLSMGWQKGQECDEQGVISTGSFLNLHCGHNNQYSSEEREKLMALIRRLCGSDSV